MALHWSVEDVANCDTTCFYIAEAEDVGRGTALGDKCLKPKTHALIFLTMPVGINHITAASADQFFTRVSAYERLEGASCWKSDADDRMTSDYITREDVVAHIGLYTNASNKSVTEFWMDLRRSWERSTKAVKPFSEVEA